MLRNDLLTALEHEAMDFVLQQRVAVAEYELSTEIENCYRAKRRAPESSCPTPGALYVKELPAA
jgi:hypothetical protein